MKRIACTVLIVLLLAALFPRPHMNAASSAPVIALKTAPAYGSTAHFQGVVYREDGGSFAPSEYRITLYLQIDAGGTYWVKPTYASPYVTLKSDGSFSIPYVTGGEDEKAQYIYIMLIPASYTPTSDFSKTRAKALDSVTVTRTKSGSVTVSPNRTPLSSSTGTTTTTTSMTTTTTTTATTTTTTTATTAAKNRLTIPVEADKIAVNVGFYIDGSQPGDKLDKTVIQAQLQATAPFADTIRLYGSAGELYQAYGIAQEMGFSVVGGAWLSGDEEADREELNALIAHCNAGQVQMAVVGSETQLRGDLTEAELIRAIQYVRDNLKNRAIPVTTADSIEFFQNSAALREACDVAFVNLYPYWSGVANENAGKYFISAMENLQKLCGSQQVLCSETGWPTAGTDKSLAEVGEAEAAAYFEAVRNWSLQTGTQIFFFEAADEPWKADSEGAVGAHWGFLDCSLHLKTVYADKNPFQEAAVIGKTSNYQKNVTYIPGQFADVAQNAWYAENVKSVWEYGLMIGKSERFFDPTGQIKVSEIITLACRLYDGYYGRTGSYDGTINWYDGYVRYAMLCGILQKGQFDRYDRPATRAEVAQLLTAALPESVFQAKNTVKYIPDVAETASYADAVYTLYRAGITIGNNAAGVFAPARSITRAEVAAMVTRTVDASLRKTVTLEEPKPLVTLTKTPEYGSGERVEGRVTMTDGQPFNAGNYRVTLYLQLEEYGDYWVKPTYEEPYVKLKADGSFSLPYAVAGTKDKAARYLHILLIPSDYTPDNDFKKTLTKALDYLLVTRTENGQITITRD